jgi:hypothetical protein
MRTLPALLLVAALPGSVWAQEVPPPPAEAAPAAQAESTAERAPAEVPSAEPPAPAELPKIAVVVAGDPDEVLQNAAVRVERAIGSVLRSPIDPGLRGALRGEAGSSDDGLEEVRRERRRLGLSESGDAPVLASLGRRAGAVAVAVVRAGPQGPEVVVLDVRNAQFFDGSLALGGADDERVAEFASRRARVSARGATIAAPVSALSAAPPAATEADEPREPDFFEQYWPYMAAGALLIAMIVVIAVTSTTDGQSQPVLRFVPGGR